MEIQYLIKGVVIGLSVSAPLGPIAVVCINKTLNSGRKAGFITSVGAGFADTLYAIIAGLGITFVSEFLIEHQFYFRIIGGLFLAILGWNILQTKVKSQSCKAARQNHLQGFLSVFLLTLSNPLTLLFFGAAFTSLGLLDTTAGSQNTIELLIVGIFFGTIIWWYAVSTIVNHFKNKINNTIIRKINKYSGYAVILLGIGLAISTLFWQ